MRGHALFAFNPILVLFSLVGAVSPVLAITFQSYIGSIFSMRSPAFAAGLFIFQSYIGSIFSFSTCISACENNILSILYWFYFLNFVFTDFNKIKENFQTYIGSIFSMVLLSCSSLIFSFQSYIGSIFSLEFLTCINLPPIFFQSYIGSIFSIIRNW